MHGALRATRGAAVAVADSRPGPREVRFAGVGNIAGADPARRRRPADDLPPRYGGPRAAKGAEVHVRLAGRRGGVAILGRDYTASYL